MKKKFGIRFVYPHKFNVTITFKEFIERYSSLANSEVSNDKVSIAGRVYSKRAMGQKLRFYDVMSRGNKIQIMANSK